MTDILMVTNEPVWPATGGGRVRMAGIAGSLAERFRVAVAQPGPASSAPNGADSTPPRAEGIRVESLGRGPASRAVSLAHRLHWKPRLGLTLLDAGARHRLEEVVASLRPRVILLSHSYLAPVLPRFGLPTVIDFQNIEARRLRSLASAGGALNGASAFWEATKARTWEPRAARRCQLASAVSIEDAGWLRRWQDAVVIVPNAAAGVERWTPSPDQGPVTYVANVTYRPNLEAGRLLLDEIWPRVLAAVPQAQLHVAGRGTAEHLSWAGRRPGVTIAGEVADPAPLVAAASLVVAPVLAGGGTQLKVIEALAQGRTVVATPFSFRSVPERARSGCLAAATPERFAAAITNLLMDPAGRHQREQGLVRPRRAIPSWGEACAPLVRRIGELLA